MFKASAHQHQSTKRHNRWALAIDVDYSAIVDDDSSGLQSLIGSIVNLTDDLAEQLMRYLINPRCIERARALLLSDNPPAHVVVFTAKQTLGEIIEDMRLRPPLELPPPCKRYVPPTFRLDEGSTRDYLVAQTGVPRFTNLSVACWALGRVLELKHAPRVYIARALVKHLPLLAHDLGVDTVILYDDMARKHASCIPELTRAQRKMYVQVQPFTIEHLRPTDVDRFLDFIQRHVPHARRKLCASVLSRAQGDPLAPWPRVDAPSSACVVQ